MLAPLAALIVLVVRRRVDAVLRVLPAAALGAAIAWTLTRLALAGSRPDLWPEVLVGRGGLVQAGWPSAVYLAACASAVVAAGPWLVWPWRRALWALTVGCAALSVLAASLGHEQEGRSRSAAHGEGAEDVKRECRRRRARPRLPGPAGGRTGRRASSGREEDYGP
ncbi:hypothetical protein [Streptomyces sp. NPDC048419]|uniref:hypothetical protein n=1 Tax=Streptomyces sp. NPDC048419 TaxID=3365547 RepID=UPI0037163642